MLRAKIAMRPRAPPARPLTQPRMPDEFCEANLAKFKVPRYIAYIDKLPKTPSEKIAKQKLVQDVADLRQGSFDRVVGKWL